MNYIIERSIAGDGIKWVQSDSYPGVYPEAVAQEIFDSNFRNVLDYRMTPVPEPIEKKYIIELWCDKRPDKVWERSWAYGGVYTMDEAQGLIDNAPGSGTSYQFRIVAIDASGQPVKPVSVQKPYRRHAAVTQLELRGAKAMLESVLRYLPRHTTTDSLSLTSYTKAFGIVMQAKLAVIRQLEAL